uniref:uncharacterized protein LOC122590142 n=1 Tax=Erigeron canadensis TaxID=72917 RepID=UPI001CB98DF2|nr:uncharacterized protein LOC122590142 [Erigeron canadensis]
MNSVGQGEDFSPTPGCKFVNTMRGSCFTAISFDDLVLEFSPVREMINKPQKCKLDLSDKMALEDQQDKGSSKIIREVLSVKNDDINLPWLKWDIKDVTPLASQPREAKSHPTSRFDMARFCYFKDYDFHICQLAQSA